MVIDQRARSFWHRTIVSSLATILLVLPAFTAGTLAVEWSSGLGVVASNVAYAVAAFRFSAVLLSYLMGRLVDRTGPAVCLGAALIVSAVGGLTVAAAPTFWYMLVGFVISGAANALGQPAVNSFLSNSAYQRLGLSMGLKQGAQPVAALLASGAALMVGFVIGWRTVFSVTSFLAFALGVLFILWARENQPKPRTRRGAHSYGKGLSINSSLVLLVLSFFGATSVYTVILSFFVVYTDGLGRSEGPVLLGLASAAAIFVRVFLGAIIDRYSRGSSHWLICGLLIGVGSFGVIGLSLDLGYLLSASVIVALAGTWGFNGVFWYGIVRLAPTAPGAITGLVAPGAGLGAALGPVLFERLIVSFGFQEAWVIFGLLGLLSAICIVWCGYALDRRYKEAE